mgnify:FL=1
MILLGYGDHMEAGAAGQMVILVAVIPERLRRSLFLMDMPRSIITLDIYLQMEEHPDLVLVCGVESLVPIIRNEVGELSLPV